MNKLFLVGSSLAIAVALSGVAQAQQADRTGEGVDKGGIADIIVTAQKRAERLQDVPISIAAVNGATLTRSGVSSLEGLQRVAPGLQVSAIGSGWVSYTYLRGAGTNQADSGSDPSIAYFMDEVYLGEKAGLQFDLLDVDRVEVLKGPQGTLFGRNAAAGAISVTTKRPSRTTEANFSGEVGNYNAYLLRATLSGPLTGDTLFYRLSLGTRHRGAFTDNLSGGKDPGELHTYAGRAELEWKGESASFNLSGDISRARNGMTNHFIASDYKGATLSPAAIATLPPGETFYRHYYDVPGYENQNARSLSGRLEVETPLGQLTSISAYRYSRFTRLQDQDGTIKDAFALGSNERTRTFSQEVRLASDPANRFKWIFGLYYYQAHINTLFTFDNGPDFSVAALRNVTRSDENFIKTKSYAAFGQATYNFTESLNLTIGGRYTKDKKGDVRTETGPGLNFTVTPSAQWQSFDPAITLDFKPMDDVMLYASYRRGFKSGGFQSLLPPTAAIAATTFLPERVKSYEAGFKSSWFDRSVVFNASFFIADITNQQVSSAISAAQSLISNAGATRAKGVDLTFEARPLSALTLSANMTYQHARFVKYLNGGIDFAGKTQLRSPDFTGVFNAEYDIDLGSGTFTPQIEYSYRSKAFFDIANTQLPNIYQPGYGVTNASLAYKPENADWRISVWGRNLGGTKYYRNIQVSPGGQGLTVPGDPFTFGISFALNFQ